MFSAESITSSACLYWQPTRCAFDSEGAAFRFTAAKMIELSTAPFEVNGDWHLEWFLWCFH